MTIIFDGPPGTKLGEGEVDGMHELLADDDLPTWELPDEPDEEESSNSTKAAGPTLSAAEAAERKVAERIYTALRAAASAADQIADRGPPHDVPGRGGWRFATLRPGPALRHGDRPPAPGDGGRRPRRHRHAQLCSSPLHNWRRPTAPASRSTSASATAR